MPQKTDKDERETTKEQVRAEAVACDESQTSWKNQTASEPKEDTWQTFFKNLKHTSLESDYGERSPNSLEIFLTTRQWAHCLWIEWTQHKKKKAWEGTGDQDVDKKEKKTVKTDFITA